MVDALLEVENLIVKKGEKTIIDDINFRINFNDEITAVLCPNNSCKTTLIKTLSGIDYATSGKIFVNGIELSKQNFDNYIINISTILDDIDDQFLFDKVEAELTYPLNNLKYDFNEVTDIVQKVSEITKISTILGKDILKLNYIEKVKTLLAASIVHSPKIILIDDIFRFLNENEKKEIFKIFKRINEELNISILYTTSDINDVINTQNIIVINDGNIIMSGTFKDIILQDNELSKIGFEIPLMIDLSRKLQFYNLIDDIYYDPDRMVDKLWK